MTGSLNHVVHHPVSTMPLRSNVEKGLTGCKEQQKSGQDLLLQSKPIANKYHKKLA